MDRKSWKIYKHTLMTDSEHKGWCYIGQTSEKNPSTRWGHNGSGYSRDHGLLFYRAIQKYGWDNFQHEIIEDNISTQELANEREKFWIAYYHSYIKDEACAGYNMTPGGESWGNLNFHWYNNGESEICVACYEEVPSGYLPGRLPLTEEQKNKLRGRQLPAEVREKLSKAKIGRIAVTNGKVDKQIRPEQLDEYLALGYRRGKSKGIRTGFKHSQETLQKMRDNSPHRQLTDTQKAHLREVNLGKKHTQQSKEKMSKKQAGKKWFTDGIKNTKAYDCPEGFKPGFTIELSAEARKKIGDATRGKKWTEERKQRHRQIASDASTCKKPVIDIISNTIYESITFAADNSDFSKSSIYNSLKNHKKITSNATRKEALFCFYGEDDQPGLDT